MPKKKPDPAAELSAKMTRALEALRAEGGGVYPTTVARLRELADPGASDQLATKAVGKPPLCEQAVVAKKKNLSAPIALCDDLESFAGSSQLLEFALCAACTEAKPTVTLPQLKKKIDAGLGEAFERDVRRRIAENVLPPDVEWLPKAKALHPLWLPMPKPPQVEMAERLVRVLEAQRRLGSESYPVRLNRLVELTGLAANKKLTSALKAEPFASRAVRLVTKHHAPPVILAEDVEQAVDHPGLLGFLLETGRDAGVQAFSVAELKARLDTRAQVLFGDAVARRMEAGALPNGVGWIGANIGKKKDRLLFRLEDVHGGRPAAAAPREQRAPGTDVRAGGSDFDAAFDEAFTRLDREGGSYNFVSLVDLRRVLPFDRAAFDVHLRRLREARRYSLSAAEGRDGLAAEQRAAGILEEGTLLLFVSRREP